jgi:hypothetical protein
VTLGITGDTGKCGLHFTLLDELFFCIVDVCLFLLNSVDIFCPLSFNLEVHGIMEILNKLDGDGDLTLILPEDGERTDGESRGDMGRDMNRLPPHVLRADVEVNLKSQFYDLDDPHEEDTSTPKVSEKHDSSLLSCKKRPKTVASKPKKWSDLNNALQTGLEEETQMEY